MDEEKSSKAPSDESLPATPEGVEKESSEKEESPAANQEALKFKDKIKEKKSPGLAPSFFSKTETYQYLAQTLLQYELEEKEEKERQEK